MEKRDNLYFYQKLQQVPQDAIKTIAGGNLKGFSDINPMWRIKMLTETFGMCGFGWKYEVTKQWNETCGNTIKTYCNINLYVKVDGEWSEPIFGTGGSSFATQQSGSLYVSDENHKMALTDALSVAMKALGVGADVYWSKGAFETKYSNPIEQDKNKVKEQGAKKADIKFESQRTKMSRETGKSFDQLFDEAVDAANGGTTFGLTPVELFKQVVKPAVEQSNTVKELESLFAAYKEICKDVMGYKDTFTAKKQEILKGQNESFS